MKKLLRGIVEYRKNVLPRMREKFAELARGQSPDTLLVTCSDSRVAPNWFASTDPGDLFVIRNVGNLVPCCEKDGMPLADGSVAAAIEFSIQNLKVSDIIVCGHSDCGAMHSLLNGREKVSAPNLRKWLKHGDDSLLKLPKGKDSSSQTNLLSQLNVLQQMEHLRSYPLVAERIAQKSLRIHGWWFELSTASLHAYEEDSQKFVLIDEEEAARIFSKLA